MNKTIKPRAASSPVWCNLDPLCVQIVNCKLSANVAHYAQEPNLVELWQCRGYCGYQGSNVQCTPTRYVDI